MNAIIIIPARYKSSRFPGKPLVDIAGKSLVRRVWEQCTRALNEKRVYIATDDERIKTHCQENGMQYIMTSDDCLTGTDRVVQAYKYIKKPYRTIINVQGDEPLVKPDDILRVAKIHHENPDSICCGMCKIKSEEEFRSPNTIKVVTDYNGRLLYASRAGIPANKDLEFHGAYKQVCIYAFSAEVLFRFTSGSKTPLEAVEDIEFLRFLELGHTVKMVNVSDSSIAVDVPEDVKKVERALTK